MIFPVRKAFAMGSEALRRSIYVLKEKQVLSLLLQYQHCSFEFYYPFVFYLTSVHQRKEDVGA